MGGPTDAPPPVAVAPDVETAVPGANPAEPADPQPMRLVQYIVVREDLGKTLGWSIGSIATQCSHASVAAVWESRGDALTEAYLAPEAINSMHKVVLKCKNELALRTLSASLTDASVPHKLWLEQPENTPTAVATKPVNKDDVSHLFKKMQLYRDLVAKKGSS